MKTFTVLGVRAVSIALAVMVAFGIQAVCQSESLNDYIVRLVFLAGLYVTLSVSLNLINGITGQFSIGHAAFYMVGAYTSATVSLHYFGKQNLDTPTWIVVSMLMGGVGAAVAGLIVGLPSLRLKGDYLAIVTLGFGEIVRILAQNEKLKVGGSYGLDVDPKHQALWLVWLLAFTCIAVSRNLLKSVHGLSFLAVREDEVAAQAMGINLTKTKVTAFVVGAAFAGAAGSLFAHNEGFINPDLFKMEVSFLILTMVVLGGTGSITGSVIAALTLFAIPELPRIVKFEASLGLLMGIGIGLIGMVTLARWVRDRYHGRLRGLVMSGAVVVPILLGFLLGKLLNIVPALEAQKYQETQIRFLILALTLLIVMLLMPNGVMGHKEFSWRWLVSKFKRQSKESTA